MAHINTADEDVDYSDFEFQHMRVDIAESEGDESALQEGFVSVSPLEDQGGLDNNEVAELVAIVNVTAYATLDDFSAASNSLVGAVDLRGTIGANLDSSSDLIFSGNAAVNNKNRGQRLIDEEDSNPDADIAFLFHNTKSEIFKHFEAHAGSGFKDEAVGTGASVVPANVPLESNHFRSLTGRGPVLDSSDNISVMYSLVKNNVDQGAEAGVRFTCVWDVTTVDDAGSKFSVPT